MTLFKNRLLCALFLLSLPCGVARAQSSLGFDFDTSNYPAWDISGSYQLNEPIIGAGGIPVTLSYTVYITHESKGKLTGSGTTLVTMGDQVVAANYKVSGSVSGGGNNTRANFNVSLSGKDWFYGILHNFNIHTSYKLNVNPSELTLTGTARGNTSVSGVGGGSIKVDVDRPLPVGVDGSWSVNMVVIPLKEFLGSGDIRVAAYRSPETPGGWPVDRVLPTEVRGSYNSSKELISTTSKGFDVGSGSKVNLKFKLGESLPQKMSGKVLGQNIKW